MSEFAWPDTSNVLVGTASWTDEEEMREFVGPVKELASQVRQVHAIFNNCYEDYGQQNAQQLMMLLSAA